MTQHIALRATALIIEDGKVLLVSKDGEAWDTPGGRAEPGEAISDAMARECCEETGVAVNVGDVCFMQETFFPEQNWRLVELFFRCHLTAPLKAAQVRDVDGSTSRIGFFSVAEMAQLPIVRPAQLLQPGWLESLPQGLSWGGSLTRQDRWKGAA